MREKKIGTMPEIIINPNNQNTNSMVEGGWLAVRNYFMQNTLMALLLSVSVCEEEKKVSVIKEMNLRFRSNVQESSLGTLSCMWVFCS